MDHLIIHLEYSDHSESDHSESDHSESNPNDDHLEQCIQTLSSHPQNIQQLKQYIQQYLSTHPEKQYQDIIYELAFFKQHLKNNSLKQTVQFLRNNQLSFQHPNFQNIAKRIDEMDHFMDKPFEVVEGVNQCGNTKCGGKRTLSYSRQTRGGDEGMTVYVFCIDCKFRYIMNS